MVEGSNCPSPPSMTQSTRFPYHSSMSSGLVLYSGSSSLIRMEEDRMGLPNTSTNANAILLSGIRMPTTFFFFYSLGRLLLPLSRNVNGPGRHDFSCLNNVLLM